MNDDEEEKEEEGKQKKNQKYETKIDTLRWNCDGESQEKKIKTKCKEISKLKQKKITTLNWLYIAKFIEFFFK